MNEEFAEVIGKALNNAKEKFMETLDNHGYGDYVALTITAHIIDANYNHILDEMSYSNLKGFLEVYKKWRK